MWLSRGSRGIVQIVRARPRSLTAGLSTNIRCNPMWADLNFMAHRRLHIPHDSNRHDEASIGLFRKNGRESGTPAPNTCSAKHFQFVI
jgi:hypothetical protein